MNAKREQGDGMGGTCDPAAHQALHIVPFTQWLAECQAKDAELRRQESGKPARRKVQ